MALDISAALHQRLRQAAELRGQSVEDMLTELLDSSPDTRSPADLPLKYFYQLAEMSPINALISDLQAHVRYISPSLCKVLGYTRDELMSMDFLSLLHPDDVESTRAASARLRESGKLESFVNRYRTASGSYCYLRWHAAISHAEGMMFAISRDITDEYHLEREAREKAEQVTRILESVTDAFFSLDRDWRFVYLNSRAEDLLDRQADELLGQSVWDEFPDAIGSTFYEQYNTAMREQVTVSFTEYYDPLETWFEVRAYPAPDTLSVYFRDVTLEKMREQQLRDSEARLDGIVNSQIDLVSRYLLDTTLTFVNNAYAEYFGYSRDELLGRRFLEYEGVASADEINERLAIVSRDPTPDVRILSHFDAHGHRRWIQWVDYGITDKTGKVIEIQAVGRDITELYETRRKLEKQKEMLQTIFDHIPVIIALFDAEGRFVLVNQKWVDTLGYDAEQMQAHPDIMAEFYPDPAYRREALAYMQSAEPGWREFEAVAKDGSRVYAEWANVRLSDGRTIGIGRDVAERKALEEQRNYAQELELQLRRDRELMELKDRFAGTVSHEFRTPLSVILSSAEMLQRYYDRMPPERIQAKLMGIQAQTEHMVGMLDDMLALSRGRARNIQLQRSRINVQPFFEGLIETMHLIDGTGHRFEMELDPTLVYIDGDPRLLQHVFANLLTNAVKYSPPESVIRIQSELQGDVGHFTIRDEGIGIPQADVSRLFEPFHRGANTAQIAGTGLGLAIVKQYVDLHNGVIYVETELGRGTAFKVGLPLKP